jgi:hypothetical protein
MTPDCPRYCVRHEIRRHWAVFLGLVVGLAVWCAVDVARRARIDPKRPALHMTDFTVYTEAGAAFFDGREPYDVSNIRGWKYLYPPLFALLVAPLGALSPPWQATVWFTLSALMAFGSYFECRRLLAAFVNREDHAIPYNPGERESFFKNFDWLIAIGFSAALFPALNCLQRGQMGLALVYPLLLGFRLLWLGNSRWAFLAGGLILALPVALKFTPALPAVCVLATLFVATIARFRGGIGAGSTTRGPRAANIAPVNLDSRNSLVERSVCGTVGLVTGCLVLFLLFPAALIGWNANLRHLHTWYDRVASRVDNVRADDFGGDVASFRNQSLCNAVYRCGNWTARQFFGGPDDLRMDVRKAAMPMDAPIVSRVLTVVRVGALLALGVVIVVAGCSGQPLWHGMVLGLAGVATLVVSPVSRGHYYVFWVPAVVFVPFWLRQIGRPRAAIVFAAVPAALTFLHYALLPYAGRVGLLGLGMTVWYFAACSWIWRNRHVCKAALDDSPPMAAEPVRANAA